MADTSKPFDQAFKAMPEVNARGFAEVMGIVEPGDGATVETLPQEISVPTVSMDAGLVVRGQQSFVAIFEAFAQFRPRILDQVLEYSKGTDTKLGLPIRVYLVPLVEGGCPRDLPLIAQRELGDYLVQVKLRWIRPWAIDAGKLLALSQAEFDACTPLFRHSPEQEIEAIHRLRPEPGHLARFKILAGLRYRKGEAALWQSFLERMNRMLTKDDLRESLAVQEWLQEGRLEGRLEGREEGLEEGREEGREEGLREGLARGLQRGHQEGFLEARQITGERLLRSAAARFPGLHLPPVLPAAIDMVALAEQIIVAPDEASARAVLTAHGL